MSSWSALRSLPALLLLAVASAAAWAVDTPAAHLALDVTLDPASRRLAVVAAVRPGQRSFRFALHE